jgi:hypothetical protein
MKRTIEFLNPEKRFYSAHGAALDRTSLDFWRWAYSDLIQNITRGIVAEYLVSCAVGIESKPRDPWNYCDVITNHGTAIEIKATGFVQAWHYEQKPKRIVPAVVLKPTKRYDPENPTIAKDKTLNADKYVICYHKEEDMARADPMDVDQWSFWILDRKDIDVLLKTRKSITIASLRKNHQELDYSGLKDALGGI